MTDTKRLAVIKSIQSKLKEITSPDYECDLGNRVFVGRMVAGDETDLPFITLWEPFSEDGPNVLSAAQHQPSRPGTPERPPSATAVVRYYIQGYVKQPEAINDIPVEDAYGLLGCIEKCLGPELLKADAFGASSVDLGLGQVRPAGTMDSKNPYCLVTLDITFTQKRGKPYD